MAQDKSRTPPLPNVHPNHNLGEYKMHETVPESIASNTQSRNTYRQQSGVQTLETHSKAPAPQRQAFPADNPMRFYK